MAYHLKFGIHDNRGHALTSRTHDAVEPKGFSARVTLIFDTRVLLVSLRRSGRWFSKSGFIGRRNGPPGELRRRSSKIDG